MAGPLTIQRFPKGLIEILGMRATGNTPTNLSDSIIGTLPLLDMYLLDRFTDRALTTGVALPGAGFTTMGTSSGPAAGFIWLVKDISISFAAVAAAATLQSQVGVSRSSNTMVGLEGMATPLLAATQAWQGAIHFEAPLIMRPGDLLAIQTTIYTGAPAVTPTGRIYYAEIGI
jgi:hypothetical protein